MSFVLVTPVKNEEDHLPKTIKSVLKQSRPPDLWVIVDDWSTDKTNDILKEAQNRIPWIRCIKSSRGNASYNWLKYARVVNDGIEYIRREGIDYRFIGLLDADIELNKNYFEILIRELQELPRIGIASGAVFEKNLDFRSENSEYPHNGPRGGARLYRSECFEDIGRFPIAPSPDAITDTKAKNRGWELEVVKQAKAIHHKLSFSGGTGRKEGLKKLGFGWYVRGYPIVHAFYSGFKRMVISNPKLLAGLYFLAGYFEAVFNGNKIKDDEIVQSNKNKIIDKLNKDLKKILRKML